MDKQERSETSQSSECNQVALYSLEYVIISHTPVEYRLVGTRSLCLNGRDGGSSSNLQAIETVKSLQACLYCDSTASNSMHTRFGNSDRLSSIGFLEIRCRTPTKDRAPPRILLSPPRAGPRGSAWGGGIAIYRVLSVRSADLACALLSSVV